MIDSGFRFYHCAIVLEETAKHTLRYSGYEDQDDINDENKEYHTIGSRAGVAGDTAANRIICRWTGYPAPPRLFN
jgi:hypothetical protein